MLPHVAGSEFAWLRRGRCVVLPYRHQERRWGAALLSFEERSGASIDLAFVKATLQQAVSAMETARLYALAIEDATTGLYVRRYFRRRLAQELDNAERRGGSVALLRVQIDGELRRAWGDAYFDVMLKRFGASVLELSPGKTIAGRVGLTSFEIAWPEADERAASELGDRLRESIEELVRASGRPVRHEVRSAVVRFPHDARSAAYLVSALDERMQSSGQDQQPSPPLRVGSVVFHAPVMRDLVDKIERAAQTDLVVLVEGETGVGKEVVVDLVHERSARSHGPLVKINCAAIPASLLESELFGHERGAFTGAVERKRGVFEQADGGTLFLDEIGEMPLEVQATLLRVLQDGRVTRLGGERAIEVDVRVVAATHRDLRSMVSEDAFREDLFYRLQGVALRVPPLRERKAEIPILIEAFRAAHGADAKRLSASALDLLHDHSWPG